MAQQKESNGTWSFYGKLPKDENGKRKNYKRRGFKSKKVAKLAEAEFLKQYNNILPTRIKLNDLIEEYHKDALNHIKLSTLKAYKRFETYVISPSFGNRYIDDITTLEITLGLMLFHKMDMMGEFMANHLHVIFYYTCQVYSHMLLIMTGYKRIHVIKLNHLKIQIRL